MLLGCCRDDMFALPVLSLSLFLCFFIHRRSCAVYYSDEIRTLDILYGRVLCLADHLAFISLKNRLNYGLSWCVRIHISYSVCFHILLHSHSHIHGVRRKDEHEYSTATKFVGHIGVMLLCIFIFIYISSK